MNATIISDRRNLNLNLSNLLKTYSANGETTDDNLANETSTVMLGLGGTGIAFLRRIKHKLKEAGLSDAKTQLLGIDTDVTSQRSEGVFPGLADHEFCHLNLESVDDILKYPESHPFIAERLGLSENPKLLTRLRDIRAKGGTQAGQVAALGWLAYLANFPVLQSALDGKLQKTFGQFADLEGEECVRRTPRIVIACSVGGGTGRSFFLDLAIYLRQALGNNVIIDLHIILPNAFRHVFKTRNQQVRADGNGAAAMIAAAAFLDGFGMDSFKFGPSEAEAVVAPENIVDKVFIYERFDANRRDCKTQLSLLDQIALHVIADLKIGIGHDFDATDNNLAAEMAVDPTSKKARRYSTTNAVSLNVNPRELSHYAISRQVAELLTMVAGSATDVSKLVKEVCTREGTAETIFKALRAAVPNDAKAVSQNLVVSGSIESNAKHHSVASLKQKVQIESQNLEKTRTGIQARLNESTKRRVAESVKAIQFSTTEILDRSGLKAAKKLVDGVSETLQANHTAQEAHLKVAKEKESETNSRLHTLQSHLGWLSGGSAKTDVILTFRSRFEAAIQVECQAATLAVLAELISYCNRLSAQLEQSLNSVQALREEAAKITSASTPDDRVFGNLSCELNLATPEMFDDFYLDNRIDNSGLIAQVAKELGKSTAEIKIRIVEGSVFENVVKPILDHFVPASKKFNVAAWIETVLTERSEMAAVVSRKINSAFENCTPNFRARTGNTTVRFNDNVLVGVPGNVEQYPQLHSLLKRAVSRLSRQNPVATQFVTSNLMHGLVILRRTRGACLHYLECWNEMAANYEVWKREGSHPVETFNQKVLASFPQVTPDRIASRNETTAAIALAMGFVAKIGSRYYRNLVEVGSNGSASFQVSLASDWDGLSFESGNLKLSNPLNKMRTEKRIEFGSARNGNENRFLTDDLNSLHATVAHDLDFSALVQKAFESLRQVAGDHSVISSIEEYCSLLQRKFNQGDSAFDVAQRHLHILRQLIAQIRGAA